MSEDDQRLDFGLLLNTLGFLLRMAQLRNFEAFYARHGQMDLRPGEYSVLWMIGRNPGVRQGQLARALAIKPAHMTKVVRRMEETGRLARTIPDDDRRSVRLTLTPAGRDFVAAHEGAIYGEDSYLVHDLTPEEAAQLTRLLRKYSGIDRWSQP